MASKLTELPYHVVFRDKNRISSISYKVNESLCIFRRLIQHSRCDAWDQRRQPRTIRYRLSIGIMLIFFLCGQNEAVFAEEIGKAQRIVTRYWVKVEIAQDDVRFQYRRGDDVEWTDFEIGVPVEYTSDLSITVRNIGQKSGTVVDIASSTGDPKDIDRHVSNGFRGGGRDVAEYKPNIVVVVTGNIIGAVKGTLNLVGSIFRFAFKLGGSFQGEHLTKGVDEDIFLEIQVGAPNGITSVIADAESRQFRLYCDNAIHSVWAYSNVDPTTRPLQGACSQVTFYSDGSLLSHTPSGPTICDAPRDLVGPVHFEEPEFPFGAFVDGLVVTSINETPIFPLSFGFLIDDQGSLDATIAGGPGAQQFVNPPGIEGGSDGVLSMDFGQDVEIVSFGFALDCSPPILNGSTLTAYDSNMILVGTTTIDAIDTDSSFAENHACFAPGSPFRKLEVTSAAVSATCPRFFVDNMTYNETSPFIFTDGFESGDTSAWSVTSGSLLQIDRSRSLLHPSPTSW